MKPRKRRAVLKGRKGDKAVVEITRPGTVSFRFVKSGSLSFVLPDGAVAFVEKKA